MPHACEIKISLFLKLDNRVENAATLFSNNTYKNVVLFLLFYNTRAKIRAEIIPIAKLSPLLLPAITEEVVPVLPIALFPVVDPTEDLVVDPVVDPAEDPVVDPVVDPADPVVD